MSSTAQNQPQSQPGDAVSREDFELLQRFLRVARLLQDQSVNLDPALTQQNHRHPGSERIVPITNNTTRTPPSIDQSNSTGAEQSHDVDLEGSYDEDDEDDEMIGGEEEDSYEETRVPPSGNTRSSTQRQRQQQQQQPQQQQRRQQEQQTREEDRKRRQDQQKQDQRLRPEGGERHPLPLPPQQQQGRQSRQPPPQNRWPRPHAAVEKRYRSVLNSKIQQLSASMPASNTFDPSVGAPASSSSTSPPGTSASQVPAAAGQQQQPVKAETKPVVLDRAVHYINHLVATYEQYESQQDLLRRKLQLWLDDAAALERVEPVQL